MTDTLLKTITRGVIRQSIKDLGSRYKEDVASAEVYLSSSKFKDDLKASEYPYELVDAINSLVLLSIAQRRKFSKQLVKKLNEF